MKMFLIALALCFSAAARASESGSLSAEYTGYSHGLTVLKLSGSLTLTPSGYAVHITYHTAGMIGMLVHSDNDTASTGTFQGKTAVPQVFWGSGHLRGTARMTRIDYVGGNPVVRALSPPVEQERTPIPVAETAHTIDTLSAIAVLIRQVAHDDTCDGTVTTFDGRRLSQQTAHRTGDEVLPATDRSIFAGRALRCDFEGRQLGGFVRNEDEDDLRKPRHGTAWLAEMVPGAPPVPVKVIFENKVLGQVTLYITAVSGGSSSAVAQCCAAQRDAVR